MTDATTAYRELLAREMKGPSDREGAMRRIQAKYGLDYWTQWGLRYRPPKQVAMDVIERVQSAYHSMLEQSVRRDLAELELIKARGHADAALENLAAQAANLLAEIQTAKETREALK